MASVKENLIAARALIDTPEKWGKGSFRAVDGCLCAVGALGVATTGNAHDWSASAYNALYDALPETAYAGVPSYNDNPNTTHAEIMALFDRAIAAQENSQ